MSYQHDERCSDDYITQVCTLYCSIFCTLDVITTNLRAPSGKASEKNYSVLESSLSALREFWEAARLSHTPKLHSLLMHALTQMRKLGGIGDILEDDVEKMHQIAGRSESRVARLKSATGRAIAEAKIEAISKNCDVKQHVERSKNLAKRKFLEQDTRLSAMDKKKLMKSEHDCKQLHKVTELNKAALPKIFTAHERLKQDFISNLKSSTDKEC